MKRYLDVAGHRRLPLVAETRPCFGFIWFPRRTTSTGGYHSSRCSRIVNEMADPCAGDRTDELRRPSRSAERGGRRRSVARRPCRRIALPRTATHRGARWSRPSCTGSRPRCRASTAACLRRRGARPALVGDRWASGRASEHPRTLPQVAEAIKYVSGRLVIDGLVKSKA